MNLEVWASHSQSTSPGSFFYRIKNQRSQPVILTAAGRPSSRTRDQHILVVVLDARDNIVHVGAIQSVTRCPANAIRRPCCIRWVARFQRCCIFTTFLSPVELHTVFSFRDRVSSPRQKNWFWKGSIGLLSSSRLVPQGKHQSMRF